MAAQSVLPNLTDDRRGTAILEGGNLRNIRRTVRYFVVFALFCIFIYHLVTQYREFQLHITLQTEQYTDNFKYPDSTFCIQSGDFDFIASQSVSGFIKAFFIDKTKEKIQNYGLLTDWFNISIDPLNISSIAMALTALQRLSVLHSETSLYVRYIHSQIPTIAHYHPHDYILSCKFEGIPCDFRDFVRAHTSAITLDCFTFPSQDIVNRRQKVGSYDKVRDQTKGLEVIFRTPDTQKLRSEAVFRLRKLLIDLKAANVRQKLGYAARAYANPPITVPAVEIFLHPSHTFHTDRLAVNLMNYKLFLTTTYLVTTTQSLPDKADSSGETCIENVPPVKPIKLFDGSSRTFLYSQLLCRNLRVYDAVLKKCGCKMLGMFPAPHYFNATAPDKIPPCWDIPRKFANPRQTLRYNKTARTILFKDYHNRVIGLLEKNSTYEQISACSFREGIQVYQQRPDVGENPCHIPCSQTTYKHKDLAVNLEFSADEATDLLLNIKRNLKTAQQLHLSTDKLKGFVLKLDENSLVTGRMSNELLRVKLIPEKLRVHTLRQVYAYTLVSLLSDVGGILGLWLGVSAVTLADLIVFGLNWFFSWRYSCMVKSQVSNENKNEAISPRHSEAELDRSKSSIFDVRSPDKPKSPSKDC